MIRPENIRDELVEAAWEAGYGIAVSDGFTIATLSKGRREADWEAPIRKALAAAFNALHDSDEAMKRGQREPEFRYGLLRAVTKEDS